MSQFSNPANWNVTAASTVFQLSSNDTTAFITTLGSATVRNSITALFVALNFLLAVAGGEFVKCKARRKVARGRPVAVHDLTSWLALSDLAKYSWSLRTLPGGWLGCLMIITGFISIGHQFLTNTLVTPSLVPARCILDYGAILSDTGGATSYAPAAETEFAIQVYQSQLAMLKNGGTPGVYNRLFPDDEVQMFRPDPSDIIGAWNCANIRNDTVPWTGHAQYTNPPSGIAENDFQFWFNTSAYMFRSGAWATTGSTVGSTSNYFWNGFLIWSTASQTDMSFVEVSILNLHFFVGGTPQTTDFDCTLTLDQPIPQLEVQQVLSDWVAKAYGLQMMTLSMEESALWLELTLDAITTLTLFNDNTFPIDIEPPDRIGCVVEGTRVSLFILLILAVVALGVLLLLLALCSLLLASLKLPKQRTALLPFDLADWQLAVYHHNNGQLAPKRRDLKAAYMSYDASGNKLHMMSWSRLQGRLRRDTSSAYLTEPGSHNSRTTWFNTTPSRASSSGTSNMQRKPMMQTYMQVPSSTEL